MPVNPLENMPEALRKQNMISDCRHLQLPKVNEQFMMTPEEHRQNLHAPLVSPSFTNETKVSSQVCQTFRICYNHCSHVTPCLSFYCLSDFSLVVS